MTKRGEFIRTLRERTHFSISSHMIDRYLLNKKGDEYDEKIRPFRGLSALDVHHCAGDRSGKDLRFLCLFPNLQKLSIEYLEQGKYLRADDYEPGWLEKPVPLSLKGIENCLILKKLVIDIEFPLVLNGIEFCENLEEFTITSVRYEEQEPLEISPLNGLSRLKILYIDAIITVATKDLDLSGCTSLTELTINPTGKTLEFVRGLKLRKLSAQYGKLRTLKGLDVSKLWFLDVTQNAIRSIKTLKHAEKLEKLVMDDNPIQDREEVERIINNLPRLVDVSY